VGCRSIEHRQLTVWFRQSFNVTFFLPAFLSGEFDR
jgi:hypothetical protein